MTADRLALVVAVDSYESSALQRLAGPAADAAALAGVLGDPAVGGFDVEVLRNAPSWRTSERVEGLFADRRSTDLVLLHFSCHGLKNVSGELYLAATNTLPDRLASTAVDAGWVNRLMHRSRAQSVVLLLDCCYGGAFERGMVARAGGAMDVGDQFRQDAVGEGRGRVVITASTAMEYAFEEARLASGGASPSVFTGALVEGIRTGDADRDRDGRISLGELYDYVYDRVRERSRNQTPSKWEFGVRGGLYIARTPPRPVVAPPEPVLPVPPAPVPSAPGWTSLSELGPTAPPVPPRRPGRRANRWQVLSSLAVAVFTAASAAYVYWPFGSDPSHPVLAGHTADVRAVAFSPDGRTLASGSADHTIRLWDYAKHKLLGSIDTGHPVKALAFDRTGARLASGGVDVELWDVATRQRSGAALPEPAGSDPAGQISTLAFSPNGTRLAAGGFNGYELWDVPARRLLTPRQKDASPDFLVAFSPTGRTVLSSNGYALHVRDINRTATPEDIGFLTPGALAYAPNGRSVAIANRGTGLYLWNPETLKTSRTFDDGIGAAGVSEEADCLAFTPNGRLLVTGNEDDWVQVWDAATGKELGNPLVGHTENVLAVAVSPDGRTIASAGEDDTIRLWAVP